jgi:hypothetical protein
VRDVLIALKYLRCQCLINRKSKIWSGSKIKSESCYSREFYAIKQTLNNSDFGLQSLSLTMVNIHMKKVLTE